MTFPFQWKTFPWRDIPTGLKRIRVDNVKARVPYGDVEPHWAGMGWGRGLGAGEGGLGKSISATSGDKSLRKLELGVQMWPQWIMCPGTGGREWNTEGKQAFISGIFVVLIRYGCHIKCVCFETIVANKYVKQIWKFKPFLSYALHTYCYVFL